MLRRALGVGCRLLVALLLTVAIPIAVVALIDAGLAGPWRWLPVCVLLVPGLAAASALATWWRYRRARVVLVLASVVWATLVLSVAYWPSTLTTADLQAGIDRVGHHGLESEFTSDGYCLPWEGTELSCPWWSRSYRVPEGQADDVVEAVVDAGYVSLGTRAYVPVTEPGLEGTAWQEEFEGHGLRMTVEVITDRTSELPLPGAERWTFYSWQPIDTVDIRLTVDR